MTQPIPSWSYFKQTQFGLFLARLNPGAKMVFEATRVSSELWLPKRLRLTGSGRVGLIKRLSKDEQIEWSNYKRFSVDSKIVTSPPRRPSIARLK